MSNIVKKNYIKHFLYSFLNSKDNQLVDSLDEITSLLKKKKNSNLFFEGELAQYFYFLIDGAVRLYRVGEDGKEAHIKFVESKEIFAEVVLFEEDVYPVNAYILTDSLLLAIDRDKFREFILSNSELSKKYIYFLVKRIKYLVDKIDSLQLEDAKGRLIKYLLYLKSIQKSNTIYLNRTKKEVSEMLGIRAETLARLLKKLDDEKVIKISSNKIILLKKF
ncbi:MAG: Crp/Fnr family transcriptional regulator [Deferribacterota bacterium]|nr:Crp/Fnr family transcriptional regulator [Deferribacterota bacterium]